MREQAHLIQAEVIHLMEDLVRLDERTRKLQGHFLAAQKDVDMILTSADKLSKRGARIEALEFQSGAAATLEEGQRSVESRTGLLKLRIVDDE